MVLAVSTFDDRFLARFLPIRAPATGRPALAHRLATIGVGMLVAILSIQPIRNMLSPAQVMNTVYNRFHLVGTYGAFGSITRPSYQVFCGRDGRTGADRLNEMARVRVQGQARRPRTHASADCAVSPPARLADVVRGPVVVRGATLVRAVHREAARRRPPGALAARYQSFPGSPAPLRARAALRVPFHDSGRAGRDCAVVDAETGGHVFPAELKPNATHRACGANLQVGVPSGPGPPGPA